MEIEIAQWCELIIDIISVREGGVNNAMAEVRKQNSVT